MKSLTQALAIAVVLLAPVGSFAESAQTMTRAQVRAELLQLEKAGYSPADWLHYPENIQAAETRVALQKRTAQVDMNGYGPGMKGTSRASD